MKWLQWALLSTLTGSPIFSLLLLVVIWWTLDHFTLGILPSPVRAWSRHQRNRQLQNRLASSPHDRRARFELAELQLDQGRHQAAWDTIRANLDAGDDDVFTLFVAGTAAYGSGQTADGERLLEAAREKDAKFRMNAIDLELGRGRLSSGNHAGAVEALQRLVAARPSSVEGRVLLARALAAGGDAEGARKVRDEAWRDYAAAPSFQKRRERFWAWRAKPIRPVMYAAAALLVGSVVVRTVGPAMASMAPPPVEETSEE